MRRPEPDDLGRFLFVMSMVLLSLGIGFGAGQDYQRAEQVERTEPDVPAVYVREVEDVDGVELVDRVTRIRHVWRPVDHEGLTDLAMDVAAMEQHVRYGGGGMSAIVPVDWTTDATWTAIHHTDHTEGPRS